MSDLDLANAAARAFIGQYLVSACDARVCRLLPGESYMVTQGISNSKAVVGAVAAEDAADRSRHELDVAPFCMSRVRQSCRSSGLPQVGRRLHVSGWRAGELCLRQRLAAGAMGEVWLAEGGGTEAAVKFEAKLVPRARRSRQHLREARILDAVRHPHVVELLGTGSLDSARPFIVMELLHGHTLASELVTRGPLPMQASASAVAHIAAALDHIHQRGIVHRDIKPQNLFLCETGGDEARVKVIDFGLATEDSERDHERVAGSIAFMNPDDLLGKTPPSVQSDLWALAVTAYLMLTRRYPFWRPSIGMWQTPLAWHFEPPSAHRADVPARLDAWFRRAFSRDPLERFRSAADACREFQQALAKHAGGSRSVRPCLCDDEILAFFNGSMSPPEVQHRGCPHRIVRGLY